MGATQILKVKHNYYNKRKNPSRQSLVSDNIVQTVFICKSGELDSVNGANKVGQIV